MRNASFWARPIRFNYKRVGGLHFVALGRITISWSVSRVAPQVAQGEAL